MAFPMPLVTLLSMLTALAHASMPADPQAKDEEYAKLAPWTAVRWRGDVPEIPEVEVNGRWHEFVAIDGTTRADVVAFCKKTWPGLVEKRFQEDLVEALARMEKPVGEKVALDLIDLETKKKVRLEDVAMTRANRQKLWQARQDAKADDNTKLASRTDDYAKLAPWTAVRWRDGVAEIPEVEVNGRWHEFVAIDGTTRADVVAFCRKTWPSIVEKRFQEDLVEALARMGKPVGEKVALDLIDLETKKKVRLEDVAMTHANRQKLWQARQDGKTGDPRVQFHAAGAPPSKALPRADAVADLDELARLLRDEYAYYARTADLFEKQLAAAKSAMPASIERDEFARRVQALLCLLGDGHTQVLDFERNLPPGFLPFLAADSSDRPKAVKGDAFAAFLEDRSGFVDPQHPWLVAIDGVPVAKWIEASARLVPRGSPEYLRWHSIRGLRFVAWLRQELGLPAGDALNVELADASGKTTTRKLRLASGKPMYGEWPRSPTRSNSAKLEGGVAYLRIPKMDDDPRDASDLHHVMKGFLGAPGLVIDVRGNGGGSRMLLRELFPYFMRASDPLHVANVAAYRLHEGDRADASEGYLGDRWLFPLASREWSADERRELERFAKSFKPSWTPPAKDFSALHFFALRPDRDQKRDQFQGPVVVLQDGGCFSATDVFLGAFQGWREVTLLGTTSGGGSGRAKSHRLPNSGLELRASTMASFRADGSRYDGVGVTPDVVVVPIATDHLGKSDSQLDAALMLLRKK